MSDLNYTTGREVALALDRKIENALTMVSAKLPYNKIERAVVQKISGKRYSVKINNLLYDNVYALKGNESIGVRDTVICVVPNNQYSNMFILGVLDIG